MDLPAARLWFSATAIGSFAKSYLQRFLSALPMSFRRQSVVLALVAIYCVCGLVAGSLVGFSPTAILGLYFLSFNKLLPFIVLSLLIGRAVVIMAVGRPQRPLSQLWYELRTSLATPERLAHATPMLAAMFLVGDSFTVLKASIPSIVAFGWDQPLDRLDRWLHGGVAPWELLQPFIGYPLITHAINWAYNLWFYFLTVIWVWQAFSQHSHALRQRFFLSLILAWILLGNVFAVLLSSAGPCYFGRVTGLPDPYTPLMDYLYSVNETYTLWALGAQEMLWRNHTAATIMIGSGISAMPSLHVALATLFALFCWQIHRWLGIFMVCFACVIMIGSVHLGWHYAVDGYFGAIGMLVIWWGAGRIVRSAAVDELEPSSKASDGCRER
jgi:hypothetical protein